MSDSRAELILIVDDDRSTRLLLRATLEQDGFRVEEASDGATGLLLFDQLQPDMVLLDLLMPGINGFETCERIRARRTGRRVPILVMTGLEDVEALRRAYDVGATDVVTKPVQWAILSYRLRYMLRAARAFESMARSEASLAQAQQFARLGSWDWDLSHGRMHWSEQLYGLLAVSARDVIPDLEDYLNLVPETERGNVRSAVTETMQSGQSNRLDHRICRGDGGEAVVQLSIDVRRDQDGRIDSVHGTVQDITERRRREEQIHELAFYDSLTGLPNRRYFKEQLSRAVALAKRNNRVLVVMFLDVDDFKRVNDTLGHDSGDALLREVSRRLMDCLRSSDAVARTREAMLSEGTVARLGGDEFTLLLPEVNHADDAARVARRVLTSLSKPIMLSGQEIVVSGSLGVAVYPEDAEDAESLLKAADTAMYHAKEHGKGKFEFFTKPMNVSALLKLMLESELRHALERDEFMLRFLPQVEVDSGRVIGFEALLRWQHPERGVLLPAEFLNVAESCGLIVPIGNWTLEAAAKQARAWQAAGLPAVPLAVNVSGHPFRDRQILDGVRHALQRANLSGEFLQLELTENLLMGDLDTVHAALSELKQLGVHLSIDDFGVGYSSLSRLKQLPLDMLKIDQSFVRDVVSDASDRIICHSIIGLARSLAIDVIAEGVETAEQLQQLREMGCRNMQGFYFAKPMTGLEVVQWYSRRQACSAQGNAAD